MLTNNLGQGNVTMNLRVGTDSVGTALLPNLTLLPGNNVVGMRSTTDQAAILKKLAAFPDGILPRRHHRQQQCLQRSAPDLL